jgi:hypothetical protein
MVDPAKGASTPPAELPARKIMRRDDGKSGNNTAANSQSASKTTSEIGGSDDGKDKGILTREEREARYKMARLKIFGSAESEENDKNEAGEGTGSGEDKDKEVSRSSSAAGKKKTRKPRNYDDDDFHSRSSFNVYYPQQAYSGPGYTGEGPSYYSVMPGTVPTSPYSGMNTGSYSGMASGPTPPQSYSNVYPGMAPSDPQAQYGWPGQQYQPTGNSNAYASHGQMQNGYDPSAQYQRGMPSYQNVGMPSQITPKMGNVSMAPYQDQYQQAQPMSMNTGWSPMPQQPSYPMAHGSYALSSSANRPMSAPHQGPVPTTYPYGQFPPSPYNGRPNHNQHPIPGSYNRQQFNPQSQAFIPGGPQGPYQPQQPFAVGNNYQAAYQNAQHQMPRMVPSATSTPSFGSPQSMNNYSPAMHRNASQTGEKAQHSSIAKYGTPSNLPQKPPAPVPVAHSGPKLAH